MEGQNKKKEGKKKWWRETREGRHQIKTAQCKWVKLTEAAVMWKKDAQTQGNKGIFSLYRKLVLSDHVFKHAVGLHVECLKY